VATEGGDGVRIRDKALLAEMHQKAICEVCNRPRPVQVHHIRTKGSGGSDHRLNLLAVCTDCHSAIHFGGLTVEDRRKTRIDLYEIVSRREAISVDTIIAEMDRLLLLETPPGSGRNTPAAPAVAGRGRGGRVVRSSVRNVSERRGRRSDGRHHHVREPVPGLERGREAKGAGGGA
jgi:hypothetical protein